MRNKIIKIAEKYIGKLPSDFNLIRWSDVKKLMVDEIMNAGIDNYRDELPSKIPLEGIIQYQDKEIKKSKHRIEILEKQLSKSEQEKSELMALTSKEKVEIHRGKYYSQLITDKRNCELKLGEYKRLSKKYLGDLIVEKRKRLEAENQLGATQVLRHEDKKTF